MDEDQEFDEPVTRVCRKCSAVSTAEGDFCSKCGTAYLKGARWPSSSTWSTAGVVLGALGFFAAVAFGYLAFVDGDDDASSNSSTETGRTDRDRREYLVRELETSITKDARKSVKAGALQGPIKYTTCTASGSQDNPTSDFECIAVRAEDKDGTLSGHQYSATIDWAAGQLRWAYAR